MKNCDGCHKTLSSHHVRSRTATFSLFSASLARKVGGPLNCTVLSFGYLLPKSPESACAIAGIRHFTIFIRIEFDSRLIVDNQRASRGAKIQLCLCEPMPRRHYAGIPMW